MNAIFKISPEWLSLLMFLGKLSSPRLSEGYRYGFYYQDLLVFSIFHWVGLLNHNIYANFKN